jgi:hypothetical protein
MLSNISLKFDFKLLSLIFKIFDLMLSDWVLFLAYPNLFEIKDFGGVVVVVDFKLWVSGTDPEFIPILNKYALLWPNNDFNFLSFASSSSCINIPSPSILRMSFRSLLAVKIWCISSFCFSHN